MRVVFAVLVVALLTAGCAALNGKLVAVDVFASQAQELGATKITLQQTQQSLADTRAVSEQRRKALVAIQQIFGRSQFLAVQADSADVTALRGYGLRVFMPVPAKPEGGAK